MRIANARVLVAGATGALGRRLAAGLRDRGAALALAGRDEERLADLAGRLGNAPRYGIDTYDVDGCARLGQRAAADLGGLDGVIVAIGVVAFGDATTTEDWVSEQVRCPPWPKAVPSRRSPGSSPIGPHCPRGWVCGARRAAQAADQRA